MSLAMIFFTAVMFVDIFAFGKRAVFFSPVGKAVLFSLCVMLMAAWMLAGGILGHLGLHAGPIGESVAALAASVAIAAAAYGAYASLAGNPGDIMIETDDVSCAPDKH